MKVNAWAAYEQGAALKPYEYELGAIGQDQVDVEVLHCGLCHSDTNLIGNDWRNAVYPLVPGHEIIGKVVAFGESVKHLKVGQTVGVGWTAESCLHCDDCMAGDHNLCNRSKGTIVGRHGGFASHLRSQASWTFPIPDGLHLPSAGPLLCGGITVFSPLLQHNITPLHHVGVVGIGGLGHMALGFLKAWGCEITAFSTSPSKEAQAKEMGAHHFVSTHDKDALKTMRGKLDMVLDTVNAPLNWNAYLSTLKSNGVLHIVGVAAEVQARVGYLMGKKRVISASPTGSPIEISKMLAFAARHDIRPQIEEFPMSDINAAITKLHAGEMRYRAVLSN